MVFWMMKLSHVTTLLMFLNTSVYVSSLKCYQCHSDIHTNCEKLKGLEYLKDCQIEHQSSEEEVTPLCRKIYQTLHFTKSKTTMVIRECAFRHGVSESCHSNPWKDARVTTCESRADASNKADLRHLSWKYVIFGSVYQLMLRFYNNAPG